MRSGARKTICSRDPLEYRMNDQGDAKADRQHEQAHSEPFGVGPSSRFVEPRSGQSGEYTSPASSARRASASSNSPTSASPSDDGDRDAGVHESEPKQGVRPHLVGRGRLVQARQEVPGVEDVSGRLHRVEEQKEMTAATAPGAGRAREISVLGASLPI